MWGFKLWTQTSVKKEIIEYEAYLRYAIVISFKVGLDRNDINLLQYIDQKTETVLKSY